MRSGRFPTSPCGGQRGSGRAARAHPSRRRRRGVSCRDRHDRDLRAWTASRGRCRRAFASRFGAACRRRGPRRRPGHACDHRRGLGLGLVLGGHRPRPPRPLLQAEEAGAAEQAEASRRRPSAPAAAGEEAEAAWAWAWPQALAQGEEPPAAGAEEPARERGSSERRRRAAWAWAAAAWRAWPAPRRAPARPSGRLGRRAPASASPPAERGPAGPSPGGRAPGRER
jgi:hypothetical protein